MENCIWMEKLIRSPWTHKSFIQKIKFEPDFEGIQPCKYQGHSGHKEKHGKDIKGYKKNRKLKVCEVLVEECLEMSREKWN